MSINIRVDFCDSTTWQRFLPSVTTLLLPYMFHSPLIKFLFPFCSFSALLFLPQSLSSYRYSSFYIFDLLIYIFNLCYTIICYVFCLRGVLCDLIMRSMYKILHPAGTLPRHHSHRLVSLLYTSCPSSFPPRIRRTAHSSLPPEQLVSTQLFSSDVWCRGHEGNYSPRCWDWSRSESLIQLLFEHFPGGCKDK